MNISIWMIIAVCAFFMMLILLWSRRESKRMNQLSQMLANQKYEEFERLINEKSTQKILSPFNLDYMKLTEAVLQNRKGEIHGYLDSFDTKKLTNRQKYAVNIRALGWCIEENDEPYCKKCISSLNKLKGFDQSKEYVQMVYRIMVEKKSDDLPQLLKNAETQKGQQRVMTDYLISSAYENAGDHASAEKYSTQAKEDSQKQK